MDVAAGPRTPAIRTLIPQQWAPQVDSSTPFNLLCLVCGGKTFVLTVFFFFFFTFPRWCKRKIIPLVWTSRVHRVEPSYREPHNTFRWPGPILADWFSSVTSSTYWVISPWVLLFSCAPGASQSPLDLLWHLTRASGCSGGSIVNLFLITFLWSSNWVCPWFFPYGFKIWLNILNSIHFQKKLVSMIHLPLFTIPSNYRKISVPFQLRNNHSFKIASNYLNIVHFTMRFSLNHFWTLYPPLVLLAGLNHKHPNFSN